ncbi:Prokaryotic ATPase [hydrothermal vent metagenome]|uniref:Prokaryotic ATPase n=1 Tax=hydrothermal vent metagenome TaxID=652676 RepID=A0A3B0U6D3_9ZZZZ
MIERILLKNIRKQLYKGKAIILLGPRQVGKTTLLKELSKQEQDVLWINADNIEDRELFNQPSATRLKAIIGNYKIVIVDEAQRIEDIGVKLKLITDELKHIQLIATGSSSFELSNTINESLTGRKFEHQLYPISFGELVNQHHLLDELKMLNHRLIYGSYPDVINNAGNEKEILQQLTNSYLYKDILEWNRIKKSDKIIKLLQAISFQVGNQVSYHELGQTVGLNSETVESYINLLEQSFVVFKLSSFSRNLRNELKKSHKIYFYDNGVRNSLIANYNPISLRNDVGALWENYLISERIKYCEYHKIYSNTYFWRTHSGQEIDYIEEREGKLFAYEFKWNKNKKTKIPIAFKKAYDNYDFKVITPENYETFIN